MKNRNSIKFRVIRIQAIFLLFFVFIFHDCSKSISYKEFEENTYSDLQIILQERKTQLINYLTEIMNLAKNVRHDEVMMNFFKTKKEYYALRNDSLVPDILVNEIEKLKQNIENYYLENYLNFYDIMFIDNDGEIFYTIRKEDDYHKNIFQGSLANTGLSLKLMDKPNESFVDFQFYEVSGEPSAFFIEPVIEDNTKMGWIVLQCGIDKINRLFSINKNLGVTGEIVLVNKEHYMLTNSRFKAEPTILKQQLPTNNIESKFKEKKGYKTVIDYRGKKVLSAFEVFEFFEKEWLIIAKVDKDEVISQYYLENQDILFPKIKRNLELTKNPDRVPFNYDEKITYVNMDEFKRCDTASTLYTHGVSTCTAVIISYPGKFSYMAHVSPYDVIYNENRTDIINQMFKQIYYFDITLSEKRDLEIKIMSGQIESFKNLIDILLNKGIFLSQIKIMYRNDAEHGNVYNINPKKKNIVNWKIKGSNPYFISQDFNDIISLEEIILAKE
ncbi:MAG: cache domain-containing protein [Bacteroidales bacterium]|nr:cache domain-containing protein [Bacteroidales bacterium]